MSCTPTNEITGCLDRIDRYGYTYVDHYVSMEADPRMRGSQTGGIKICIGFENDVNIRN